MLTGAAAVFDVRDPAAARDWYRDVLGFTVTFEYGTPLFYICLCRDDVQLHLRAANGTTRQAGQASLCVFVRDIDAFHAEITARGATPLEPPTDRAYGMRDFDLRDPDGNQITFGMASSPHD
jgi:catechol 2,3-dioxygenase-like lactoylglutathione lyase family enzyme